MATIDTLLLTIRIGNDFNKMLTFYDGIPIPGSQKGTVIDMTGYAFKMQIRKCKSDATAILTLESPANIDTTNAATGIIIINITDTVTATLTEGPDVYDLQWTTDLGIVTTILEGNVQILETVTK